MKNERYVVHDWGGNQRLSNSAQMEVAQPKASGWGRVSVWRGKAVHE